MKTPYFIGNTMFRINHIALPRAWMMGWAFSVVALFAFHASAIGPSLLDIGPEETLGPGRISSVAADTRNQPHVVADGGSWIYMYDKVGGAWRSLHKDSGPLAGSQQYYNPHVEIDSGNRAWYTGVLFGGAHGLGLILRSEMDSNPSDYTSFSRVRIARVFDVGNHSLDPARPTETVVSSTDGGWKRYVYDNTVASRTREVASGQMYAGQGGEKSSFWISKAGAIRHANNAVQSVYHGATGGWAKSPSAYQNSMRQAAGLPIVVWASYDAYKTQEDDGAYPRVVSDMLDPEVAYIACDFSVAGRYGGTAGVAMNIWNGTSMNAPANAIIHIDPAGTSGLRRYAPSLAPAKGGGAFIAWSRGNRVKIRYVPASASTIADCGAEIDISEGTRPAIAVDGAGNMHMTYVRDNTLRYRFLMFDASSAYVSTAGDFDGDNIDDLAVYDPEAGDWYIRKLGTGDTTLAWKFNWGYAGAMPTPGDFDGNGVDELVVYDQAKGVWHMKSLNNSLQKIDVAWGFPGSLAVAEDYDNDGADDLAVYSTRNGSWAVRSFKREQLLTTAQWGFATGTPVPGDYDGDGDADLAIFDTVAGDWFILRPDLNILHNTSWGWAGAQVFSGDFNGDGTDDMAVYNVNSGDWYIRSVDGTILRWNYRHGYAGTTAVPGDYDGDGKDDLAVYDARNGRWFIVRLDGTSIGWNIPWGYAGAMAVPGDFNGDGSSDLAVFDTAAAKWYIRTVGGQAFVWNQTWGVPGSIAVPGDFNGDGKSDMATYRSADQRWQIQSVNGGPIVQNQQWGYPGVMPTSGDFDNNGADEMAVYDPNNARWYTLAANGTIILNGFVAGATKGQPVPGDYNGDGRTDPGVFVGGRWFAVDRGRVLAWKVNWGFSGGYPVAGDYDGDKASDLAIYDSNAGNWYIYSLKKKATLASPVQWGFKPTLPVSGNFDGDGLSDLAVFGTSQGNWFIRTLSGQVRAWYLDWGSKGHIPVGSSRY